MLTFLAYVAGAFWIGFMLFCLFVLLAAALGFIWVEVVMRPFEALRRLLRRWVAARHHGAS